MNEKIIRNTGTNFYTQLYELLKAEIVAKKMKSDSKFYSVRQTVIKFDVNINTVLRVYRMLEENGYIYSIKGKGCFVKEHSDFTISDKVIPIMESFRYGQQNELPEINFSNGTPSKDFFPVEVYQKLSEKAIKDCGRELFGYQHVQGLTSLREVLADYLEKDDIFVEREDIIITSGTQQSLDIVVKAFGCHPVKTVVISNPTYPNAINLLGDICNVKTMDLENDGWDMEKFEEMIKKEKIHMVYVVSNFQNPTGIVMRKKRSLFN